MSEETDNTDLEYNADLQIQYKTAIKKYLLQCIIMEGSKIILFFIIFAYFHVTLPYIIALLVLMLVRCNGGGLHCKHYISCFLLSLFVLSACIFCGMNIPIHKLISFFILVICSISGYICAPVVSRNRPEPDEELIQKSKKRTATIILLYCFVICICPYNPYLNIGTWTIIIHIIQLLLAKSFQRRDDHVYSWL